MLCPLQCLAWIRRSTLAKNRPRYRRRSTSAEVSEPVRLDTIRDSSEHNAPASVPLDRQEDSMNLNPALDASAEGEGHFDPYGMTSIPDDQSNELSPYAPTQPADEHEDDEQDSQMSSSALGLTLPDETNNSTARRFSRAFAEDKGDHADREDMEGSHSVAGPFTGSKSRLLHTSEREDGSSTMSENAPLILSPLPIHPTNSTHYSHHVSSPFIASEGEYAGTSPPSHVNRHALRNTGEHGSERTISPLRTRLEQKTSTATPPSFSANLTYVDTHASAAHHGSEGEQSIVPFWFDQHSVHFDSSDELENDAHDRWQNADGPEGINTPDDLNITTATGNEVSPSISPTQRKELASQVTSDGGKAVTVDPLLQNHSVMAE